MRTLLGLLFLVAVIAAAMLITVAAIAMMRRDRERRHGSGQLGHAMQELESLFVESKKHVIEAEQEDRSEEDDSGDPPEK